MKRGRVGGGMMQSEEEGGVGNIVSKVVVVVIFSACQTLVLVYVQTYPYSVSTDM